MFFARRRRKERPVQEPLRKTPETPEDLSLSAKEKKLIRLIREMRYGELQVFVAEGQPVRLEEVRRSIKL